LLAPAEAQPAVLPPDPSPVTQLLTETIQGMPYGIYLLMPFSFPSTDITLRNDFVWSWGMSIRHNRQKRRERAGVFLADTLFLAFLWSRPSC